MIKYLFYSWCFITYDHEKLININPNYATWCKKIKNRSKVLFVLDVVNSIRILFLHINYKSKHYLLTHNKFKSVKLRDGCYEIHYRYCIESLRIKILRNYGERLVA